MGYQVGNHCYATKAEAENVYFSLVVPIVATNQSNVVMNTLIRRPPTTIKNTSSLVKPDYINGKWQLNGKVINANLPHCDPVNSIKDGSEIGWIIFGIIASCYIFVILKRLLI